MRIFLSLLLVLFMLVHCCFAQPVQNSDRKNAYVSPVAVGFHFLLNDFTTPQRIRSTSLTAVIQNKQLAKIKEMYPGIGLSFYKGLLNHIDFAGSLQTSFVRMQINNDVLSADNDLLLEAGATVNLKMLTDKFVVDPYLIIGMGGSKYKGYYGAFIPLGAGIKINFFDEAALIITTQYRVPVTTETSNYHFVHSIGIAGVLKPKKLPAQNL